MLFKCPSILNPLVAERFRWSQYHGFLPVRIPCWHLVCRAAVAIASAASPGAGGGQSELLFLGPMLWKPNLHLLIVTRPDNASAGPLGAGGVVNCGSEFLYGPNAAIGGSFFLFLSHFSLYLSKYTRRLSNPFLIAISQ